MAEIEKTSCEATMSTPRNLAMSLTPLVFAMLIEAPAIAAQEAPACLPASRSVGGLVAEAESGVPLPGVTVYLAEEAGRGNAEVETTSNLRGYYTFCDLVPETVYRLRAEFLDFESPPTNVPDGTSVVNLALHAKARRPARVLGRLTDRRTSRPITAALVRLESIDRSTSTDNAGFFTFDDVPAGLRLVVAEHLGHARVEELVRVPPGETVDVQIQMSANPVEMEPIVVTTVRDRRLEIKGFYERRRWGEAVGNGIFIDREELRRRMPARLSSLIEALPGTDVRCRSGYCRVRFRRAPAYCESAEILLDGMTFRNIDQILIDEIGAIEVYRSVSELPADFGGSNAQCGVIAVWTRSR